MSQRILGIGVVRQEPGGSDQVEATQGQVCVAILWASEDHSETTKKEWQPPPGVPKWRCPYARLGEADRISRNDLHAPRVTPVKP